MAKERFFNLPVVILIASSFMLGMSEFIVVGILPDIAADLKISEVTVGNLVSLFAFVYAPDTPLGSALSARFPIGIFLAGNILCAFAPNYAVLVVARIMIALVSGTLVAVAMTYAPDVTTDRFRTKFIAWVFSGFSIASVVGVPVGTWVANTFGWRWAFHMINVLTIMLIVGMVVALPRNSHIVKIGFLPQFRQRPRRRFLQYEFATQWKKVKDYANAKGVKILGDIPIYVSADSVDAWVGGELFELDAQGGFARVAGCPPDYFSADGQLWGNPLYNWPYHKQTGYAWWIRRVRHALGIYDLLRIDHFRGFDTYWAIPAGSPTACTGKWEIGPRMDLFHALEAALGKLPIIAEDLGELFPSVRELLADSTFPGMKVLQFAFGGGDNEYLPHISV